MENIWANNAGLITDVDEANNYLVETALADFQTSVKTITDMAVWLSAHNEKLAVTLEKYRRAVAVASQHLRLNQPDAALHQLNKVAKND